MYERHADKTFYYDIPVTTLGVYTLILKFSELYFTEKHKRLFHIKIGDY